MFLSCMRGFLPDAPVFSHAFTLLLYVAPRHGCVHVLLYDLCVCVGCVMDWTGVPDQQSTLCPLTAGIQSSSPAASNRIEVVAENE